MAVDRRATILLMMAMLIPGCAQAKPQAKAPDLQGFRRRFVDPSGRIVDTGNGGISHSEGQGYGMLLAEADGDRAAFDLIWNWTRQTLMRPDQLFSWRYDPKAAKPVGDPNNASDGDILIAWALLRASHRWPEGHYGDIARSIRGAIAGKLIVEHGGRQVLLPGLVGFVAGDRLILNPSYYVWPALDAFAKVDGGKWRDLVRDGDFLIKQARFGASALPTDWIDLSADGKISLASGKPPRFGFDAIRVPLYLAWSKRSASVQPFRDFWSGFVARHQPIPAWVDVATGEVAPFALSVGAHAVARLVVPGLPATNQADTTREDYYSSILAALSALAATADKSTR